MNIFSITSVTALFLMLSLSGSVLFLDTSRNRANTYFVLIGFSSCLWVLANFLADMSVSPGGALFWSRTAIIGPAFMPTLLYALVIELYLKGVESFRSHAKILRAYTLVSSCILLFSYTSFNVKMAYVENWGTDFVPGPLYYLLLGYLFFGFLWIFILLFNVHRFAQEPARSQVKYIFIGTVIPFIISALANIVLPILGNSKASLLGPPSMVFFVFFTGIAILRYKLFNVRVITVELITLSIWLIIFVKFLSSSGGDRILNGFLLVIVVMVGVLLIRGVLRDIKIRHRVEQLGNDLVIANEQLRRMDKQKSDFVSIASHQLRTPLTAIKGYASLMLEGSFGAIPNETREAISKIFESSQRMIMIVENFLTVSRIERGRMFYRFETIDLRSVARDTVKDMRHVAEGYGLRLDFKDDPSRTYHIRADQIKIKQVIHNLVDESVRHTRTGFIEVSLSFSQHGDTVSLAVSDTGEGATKNRLKHIFDKYEPVVRNDASQKEAGVELFIVKEIVKAHRGRVWAESEGPGKGMTFFVEFPSVRERSVN